MRLRVGHQQAQFWPILARLVDCYSMFWGPGVISTVGDPRGALTCRSSTVAILADSGPFHGLLLTVLGSTPGAFTCRSSTLGVLVDSGLFRALLLTILGSKSDFHD